MKILNGSLVLAVLVCGAAVYYHAFASTSEQQSTSANPQPTPASHENPNQEINNRFVKDLSGKIAGRENEPAVKVFKNIQIEWLKNAPAGRFLRIMISATVERLELPAHTVTSNKTSRVMTSARNERRATWPSCTK